ncbi:fructosamine kinase family protein [Imperialibacter roseus]|uniref:Fructosamine kinase family protein n=1 Tax=Imperialibacter roseus TaxID=1324217 RepID=A0ABZ0ITR8_9BACT|nr:fructosamine kinase family protein [Imperialibacter roseus]WOK08161.1 fructosamine kinase family protein [Imperialibacter roseus]
MFDEHFKSFFEKVIFQSTGVETEEIDFSFVAGGCINNTVKLSCKAGVFFLKWNESAPAGMFQVEARGLKLLQSTGAVRVPEIINTGSAEGKSYLLLEFLAPGRKATSYAETLGRELAALHQNSSPFFGLDHDNYIGQLLQKNETRPSWVDFFIECRLKPQVGLAAYNGLIANDTVLRFEAFYDKLPALFPEEPPSLLHGDLWSGNVHTGPDGHAWLIDPAVYFGHREMDLAFTQLFGGFEPSFYSAYHESFPLQPGWEERTDLCNLYPLMVHVNLFGTSYLAAVERTLSRYI